MNQLLNQIKTDNIYVSFDADVGAYKSIFAARFLDRIGLEEKTISEIARQIGSRVKAGQFELVGFDVMEIDTHLLGLELPEGRRDTTCAVCNGFIRNLLAI